MQKIIIIIFYEWGPYHWARARAARLACDLRGWQLFTVAIAEQDSQHPWGWSEENFLDKHVVLISKSLQKGLTEKKTDTLIKRKLLDVVENIKPNALFIPGWGFSWARHLISKYGKKVALMSESKEDDQPRSGIKEFLKSFFVKKASTALVGGERAFDYVVKLGMKSQNVFLGYDSVDNDYFEERAEYARRNEPEIRVRYPRIPAKPFFLTVTRLIERKNLLNFLRAYAEYINKIGRENAFQFVIAGSGKQEKILKDLVLELGIKDFVTFAGFLSYTDLPAWYSLAHAYVHPALSEQWGLVINEACASGLPVLASRTVGACDELVRDGVNGFTFDPVSRQSMVEVLLKFHVLSQDDREEMGKQSKKLAALLSPERFAEGFLKCIENIG